MAEEFDKYQIILQELVRRSNDSNVRLRMLEQKVQSLEERTNHIEETMTEKVAKINDKFLTQEALLRNISDDMMIVKNTVEKLNRQITKFAMKKDIKEIERMFDLLSPIKNEFVTRNELERELEKA